MSFELKDEDLPPCGPMAVSKQSLCLQRQISQLSNFMVAFQEMRGALRRGVGAFQSRRWRLTVL